MNGRLVGVLSSCVLAVLGCESRVSLGARCSADAECPSGLVCSVGRCRTTCESAADCESGRRCLAASGQSVCSTVPDDACLSVEDCGDPAFATCVDNECRTRCTEQSQCNGGECVLSGCVERPLLDTAPIGRVAFGDARPSDTQVGSTVLANPDAPAQALELSYDAAYAGIAVTVEDASSGGSWAAHVASMERTMNADGRRDPGVGLRIDVDLDGPLATRIAREHYLNSFTSAVAAEAQADGSLVYLWTVRSASESIDSPNTVAFVARDNDPRLLTMGGPELRTLPPPAVLLGGFGDAGDEPAFGLTVVDAIASEIQVTGPGAGPEGIARIPLPDAAPPRAAVGTTRAMLIQHASGRVALARIAGTDNPLEHAEHPIASASSCAPSIVDRDVVAAGNYVVGTCLDERIELRRLRCSTDAAEALEACADEAWTTIAAPLPPTRISLESWPRGVIIVSEDSMGLHVDLRADETLEPAPPRQRSVLPASYRVDAFTDYRLVHWAAHTAWRDDAAVLVVAGLYVDDNDVAQVRLGVLEVTAR